jgi:hypothetical protein
MPEYKEKAKRYADNYIRELVENKSTKLINVSEHYEAGYKQALDDFSTQVDRLLAIINSLNSDPLKKIH